MFIPNKTIWLIDMCFACETETEKEVNTPLKTIRDEIQTSKEKWIKNFVWLFSSGTKGEDSGWMVHEEGGKNMQYFTQLLESNKKIKRNHRNI